MTLQAEALSFANEQWTIEKRTYDYRGKNRKAAITWALKKIEQEFPGHNEYIATITETV